MANPWAGEVDLVIDGERHVLKLTLGALAELEAGLESGSLVDLVARFEGGGFCARDILALIVAGLRGGGWDGDAGVLSRAEIAGGPVEAARVAALLLARASRLKPMAGFDWPALMRAGLHGAGLRPAEFWALTPAELQMSFGAGRRACANDKGGA